MSSEKSETFQGIVKEIDKTGWYRFGKKEFVCKSLCKENIEYYLSNKKLPPICDTCYKALIFWDGVFDEENIIKFFQMSNSFDFNFRGKLNQNVVVFYFHDKDKMLSFKDFISRKLLEFKVRGRTQWRRACRYYQDLLPNLWKNAKIFIPDLEKTSR